MKETYALITQEIDTKDVDLYLDEISKNCPNVDIHIQKKDDKCNFTIKIYDKEKTLLRMKKVFPKATNIKIVKTEII